MVKGITLNFDEVLELLADENTIKEAAKNFKILLNLIASFGGEGNRPVGGRGYGYL